MMMLMLQQLFDSQLARRGHHRSQLKLDHHVISISAAPAHLQASTFPAVADVTGPYRPGTRCRRRLTDVRRAASPSPPWEQRDECRPVAIVHPPVEDRVDAGRAEGHDAAQHVAQFEESAEHEVVSELGDHKVHVERRARGTASTSQRTPPRPPPASCWSARAAVPLVSPSRLPQHRATPHLTTPVTAPTNVLATAVMYEL